MSKYDIQKLRSLPVSALADLPEDQFIVACWQSSGIAVLEAIEHQHTIPMCTEYFIDIYCLSCGGDWGGMLLTGIKALYPEVYDAIPENMGHFAWRCICSVLTLLGITE